MRILSLSILTLALAIAYASFIFSQRPVVQPVVETETITKPAELLDWEDEQVQEFLDNEEGWWYPIEAWLDTPVSDIKEFEPINL